MITRKEINRKYDEILLQAKKEGTFKEVVRELVLSDLFFFSTRVCKRKDIDCDWLYERCREVQLNPNGYIDLWPRDHRKTTIITKLLTIQDILKNPEEKVGILSYNMDFATSILKQIREELENNKLLYELFPDVLWKEPRREAPQWNESGFTVKRKANLDECTVEAYGVVDTCPTGKHWTLVVYDDLVHEKFVKTDAQIENTTKAWATSLSLMDRKRGRRRYVGTRYHYNDTYQTIIDSGAAIPRIHTVTDDGTNEGKPVFFTQEEYEEARQEHSKLPFVWACQYFQNPKMSSNKGFKEEWFRVWIPKNFGEMNVYIIVDSANTKKNRSDYTVMLVIGVGADNNFYVIDAIRDKLNMSEKARILSALVRKYNPIHVGYEIFGAQADLDIIKHFQDEENYHYRIKQLGGNIKKEDRIQRLQPFFEQENIFFPQTIYYTTVDGEQKELTRVFLNNEYLAFPFCAHDDMLDALSRILDKDMNMKPPLPFMQKKRPKMAIMD